jgi:heme-degrading monooxygenase HmoA
MIALVFSYEVSDPEEFERVYGPEGDWAAFFRDGRGYIGTELLRDIEMPGRYLVIDRWESAQAYDAFVAANREEYMRRVDDTAFLYQQELRFGTFEAVWAAD